MPRSDASSVVTTYVKAWTSGDFDTARSTLRDDVAFVGPLGTADGIASHLTATKTDVLVSLLPTGSQQASETYAAAALRAGCAFINCMPAVMARSEEWA